MKKKLFFKKITISNLNANEQKMIYGGESNILTCQDTCGGTCMKSCYHTCGGRCEANSLDCATTVINPTVIINPTAVINPR